MDFRPYSVWPHVLVRRERAMDGSAQALHLGSSEPNTEMSPHNGLPPGPRSPGWMQTSQWMFRPIEFMNRCREHHGRIFTIRLGPAQNVVMVGTPDLAKQALSFPPEALRAGATNGIFRPVVGSNSILLLDGDAHMRQRRIMLRAFGASHAAQF